MEQSEPEELGEPEERAVARDAPGVPPGGQGAPADRPAIGPVKRGRSWKTVLLVVALVLGVLCSGTVGYGLWWYNQETKPDRSAPDVVVSNYLRAFLGERDEIKTNLYVCRNPQLNTMQAFKTDIEQREQKYAISIRVSWSGLDTTVEPSGTVVQTTVRRSISDGSESDKSTWKFIVVDEDGWRVCSAEKVS